MTVIFKGINNLFLYGLLCIPFLFGLTILILSLWIGYHLIKSFIRNLGSNGLPLLINIPYLLAGILFTTFLVFLGFLLTGLLF